MSQNRKKQLINAMTILRIVGIPIIFMLSGWPQFIYINFLFITDFLDGYFARKYNVVSKVGGLLDLIADKTIVAVLLIAALMDQKLSLLIVVLVLLREIISMLIRYLKNKENGNTIPPSIFGKLKTTFQFIAFDMMLLNFPFYKLMFWVVIVLGYYSLAKYLKIFFSKGEKNV